MAVFDQRVRVLVTRPGEQARQWAQALTDQGIDAHPFPLMEILPLADPSALQRVWQTVPMQAAVMFVSANAVHHFMAQRPVGMVLHAQAWATGPGTERALQREGWPPALIRSPRGDAAHFDSESLWSRVADEVRAWSTASAKPAQVLIVRGADAAGRMAGRDWLAQRLQQSGVQVCECVAYRRAAACLDQQARTRALQALAEGDWWLFSSTEAAQNLIEALPQAPGHAARALATHPRIAQRLLSQGWPRVQLVPAELQAQAASIKCLT